jgi:L-fuconolactonase
MSQPIIDAHLHVWQMPSDRYPWRPLRNMRPAAPAPVEALLETMPANGVAKAVIVQPSNYGYDHHYVRDCLATNPGRFGAVALLDFQAPDAAFRLRDLVQQGFKGMRLFLYNEPSLHWVDSTATDRVLDAAAASGAIICSFGHWDMLAPLAALARRHPDVPFVLDHLGHPDVNKPESWPVVLRMAELPNVHIKISDFPTLSRQGYPYLDLFPFVRQVHAAFGAQRMMWASNWPNVLAKAEYAPVLRLVEQALPDLPEADSESIMGGTAARLWILGK